MGACVRWHHQQWPVIVFGNLRRWAISALWIFLETISHRSIVLHVGAYSISGESFCLILCAASFVFVNLNVEWMSRARSLSQARRTNANGNQNDLQSKRNWRKLFCSKTKPLHICSNSYYYYLTLICWRWYANGWLQFCLGRSGIS